MRGREWAFTLGILLAAACGRGGTNGKKADASTPTGTTTATTSSLDAAWSQPDSGGAATSIATSTPLSATGSSTMTATSGTSSGTGSVTSSVTTGTDTGTSETETSTATATSGTTAGTMTATSGTTTGSATATSSTTTGTDGGTIDAGTSTATAISSTATGTGSATGDAGICDLPSCYTDLLSGCIPDGACVQQTQYLCEGLDCTVTMVISACYANGVKTIYNVDLDKLTAFMTVKKDDSVCYAYDEVPHYRPTGGPVTMVMKNPAGTIVASYVVTERTESFACTGGPPLLTDRGTCGPTPAMRSMTCTPGTCAP